MSAAGHVVPLGHIILIPSQPVFALTPKCCVISGEAVNTNFIVIGLTRPGLEPTIYRTRGKHTHWQSWTRIVCPSLGWVWNNLIHLQINLLDERTQVARVSKYSPCSTGDTRRVTFNILWKVMKEKRGTGYNDYDKRNICDTDCSVTVNNSSWRSQNFRSDPFFNRFHVSINPLSRKSW